MEINRTKLQRFFVIDDFCKEYDAEIEETAISAPNGRKHRKRKWAMGRSEIMSILICFHFNTFRNFKHYYLFYVKNHLHDLFPNQLSYNRFIELELLLYFKSVRKLGCGFIKWIPVGGINLVHT